MPSPTASPPRLSVVVPAFNEERLIADTLERIRVMAEQDPRLAGRVEVIVVSDGSTDGTFDRASASMGDDLPGTVVELASNVGSHTAIRCGLAHANGELIVVLSADGQDSPELIPSMIDRFDTGIQIVWGERSHRKNDPRIRRLLASVYYRLFRIVTSFDYPPSGLDFVMFTSPVRQSLLAHKERNTSLFLLLFNLGFGQATVKYDRQQRSAGESKWTLRKRVKLAIDMLTGFSAAPIRLVSVAGVVVGTGGLLLGGYTIIRALMNDVPVSGWASLMVVSSLMGGSTLVAIALIGEYLWRTLDEVRSRPLYLEARRHKAPDASAPGVVPFEGEHAQSDEAEAPGDTHRDPEGDTVMQTETLHHREVGS